MELWFSDPLELSSLDSTFTLLVLLLLWGCCLTSCIRLHWVKVCWSTYRRRCEWCGYCPEAASWGLAILWNFLCTCIVWYVYDIWIRIDINDKHIYIYIYTRVTSGRDSITRPQFRTFQDVPSRIGSSWQGLLDCAVHQWIGWLGAVSVEGCRMLVWVCWINLPQSTWWFV